MGWLRKISLVYWFYLLCVRIIRCGPIPKHIAFIMDGNRRYASKNKNAGHLHHKKGYEKMCEVIYWCLHLGVEETTVFGFSIENFKRSEDEVNNLHNLAMYAFQHMLKGKDSLNKHGVRIRVIGNMDMIRDDVRQLIERVTFATKGNCRLTLNIAIAYTSRHEITTAISNIVEAIENKMLRPNNVSQELLSKHMYISDPELIIRTSGEQRFSDFLLWQISASCVYFTDQLWPEFSFWNQILSILYYQRHCAAFTKLRQVQLEFSEENRCSDKSIIKQKFLDKVITDRIKKVELCVNSKKI